MLHIVTASNASAYKVKMQEALRLRHRVFVEEKKWTELDRGDGLELDQFDTADAVHMLYMDRSGAVLGYQRMLPSTKPHLLSEVMPSLCDGERPVGPHIWEWTRYAVDKDHRDRGRMLSPVGLALLTGIVEWGLETGANTIIIQMNPLWLLRLVQMRFKTTPLGFPQEFSGEATIAITAEFNRTTLAFLHELRGSDSSVFYKPDALHLRSA
jgi:acyl-homoserine lactone synthase